MDVLQKCICLKPGLLLEKVPCPPPIFYNEFSEYASTRNLSRTDVCDIAKTCIGRHQTTNSSRIIENICNPKTTTIPTRTTTITTSTESSATPTNVSPQTISTTTTSSSFSITSSLPVRTTTTAPVPPCNGVCIFGIIFGICMLIIAIVVILILTRKFKCSIISRLSRHSKFSNSGSNKDIFTQSRETNKDMCEIEIIKFTNPGFDHDDKTVFDNNEVVTAQVETANDMNILHKDAIFFLGENKDSNDTIEDNTKMEPFDDYKDFIDDNASSETTIDSETDDAGSSEREISSINKVSEKRIDIEVEILAVAGKSDKRTE